MQFEKCPYAKHSTWLINVTVIILQSLRELQAKNIIEHGYNRRAHWSNTGEGDKSEMCAVNAKYFAPENKDKRCPNFILNMDLNVPEAMSLNLARSTDNLTSDMHKMTKVIVFFTVIATIATIYSVCH